jgi:hypothetical protein
VNIGVRNTRTYAANSFEQIPLAAFVDGTPRANGTASIFVTSGSAIIYWPTTDNRTKDSATKFLVRP